MKKILIVVGTRPNFIKVTRFKKLVAEIPELDVVIVHTGQHYDNKMSDVFFEQFELVPDHFLHVEPSTPATQMGVIMQGLEEVAKDIEPNLMMVVGDVNSTLAGALVANKMGIRIAHLESGLRSDDRSMPEEINRILTDEITDLFFITEQSGMDNLLAEGKTEDQLFFVGNTMIDTLVGFEEKITQSDIMEKYGLSPQGFVLMTIHRPATVDNKNNLTKLIEVFEEVGLQLPMVFPIHPRTTKNAEKFGLKERLEAVPNLIRSGPMDYFSFQKLIANCSFILTDSGGIQEESTYRQIPCLTLRPNTERPSTVTLGTNQLLSLDKNEVLGKVQDILDGKAKQGSIPPMWDGHATERILQVLKEQL